MTSSDLTVAQGAVLAVGHPVPGRLRPRRTTPTGWQAGSTTCSTAWSAKGWLTAERARRHAGAAARRGEQAARAAPNYYLMDTVRRELKANGFTDQDIDLGGLRVTTTFDKRSQRAAVRAVRQERPRENARNVHIGLSAVQPGTGAVVAMYGGATAGGLNEATQARVQPGSAFKPFALAGALRDGIGLKSRFAGNSPLDVPGTDKEVNNEFDRDYGTSVDLVKATEQSINTAYVDLTAADGAAARSSTRPSTPASPRTPRAWRPTPSTPSARRRCATSTWPRAYATFAAKGKAATWYTVQEVKGANGGTRYKAHPTARRGPSTRTSWPTSTTRCSRSSKNGTGTEAQALGRPAAAKTGTAALRPDTTTSAWFVGYTPQLSAAVDFYKGTGRADLDGVGGLSTFFGGEYPARIWTAFMTAALQGKDVETFPPPAYVGETVNPQPTSTPTPTESTETPTRDPDGDAHRRRRPHRCRRRRRRPAVDSRRASQSPTPTAAAGSRSRHHRAVDGG